MCENKCVIEKGSSVVLFRDNSRKKVFLIYRSDYPCWVVTGGGVELGETPKHAAIREAKEESGFNIKIVRNVGEYILKKNGLVYQNNYLFEGRVLSGRFRPEYPGCRGKWFEVGRLPPDMFFSSKEIIMDALNSKVGYFMKEKNSMGIKENLHLLLLHPLAAFKFLRVLIRQVGSYVNSVRKR